MKLNPLIAIPEAGVPITREKVLELCAKLHENGLDERAELFTGSSDEWNLRIGLERWQERNSWVVYGCESPQPYFVRAALAVGNLRLMQREFMGEE